MHRAVVETPSLEVCDEGLVVDLAILGLQLDSTFSNLDDSIFLLIRSIIKCAMFYWRTNRCVQRQNEINFFWMNFLQI